MSSILKALKKLEEEKTSGRRGNADIARAILMGIPRRTGKPGWVLPVSVAGAAFTAALLTYLVTGGTTVRSRGDFPVASRQATPKASDAKEKTETLTATPSSRVIYRKEETKTISLQKSSVNRHEGMSGPTLASRTRSSSPLPKKLVESARRSAEQSPAPAVSKLPSTTAEMVQPPQPRPLPTLKVTGIAWQKDSADRLAVINGLSVTEGMTVEGVRVEEIFPDKVRFSFEKRTFDVAVGRGSQ
jgi:general secretion pathway protein B